MHDHRPAPTEGAILKFPGEARYATVATVAALPVEPAAGVLLVVVILVGLAAIGAWVRRALRTSQAPGTPTAPRLAAVPPSADERERPPVIGYAALEAGDLDDAAGAIGDWCENHGWPLGKVIHDTGGARVNQRPGLAHALEEIRAGHAAGLVVARLRDLADSVTELGPLLRWFAHGESFVIALDYELDTSSDPGEFAAGALVAISDWERDRVEGRTRAGLDAARRGAAVRDDPELSARIAAMRDRGMSLQAIADALNRAGVPTLRGGTCWRPSSVQAAAGYKRPPKSRGVDARPMRRAEGED
jgi:DNA invertase Pin-like site-specific DNA recombinase